MTMERSLRQQLPGGTFAHVPQARSRNMAAIRGSGNLSTERRLRAALVRAGISGWRLHPLILRGRPDFYFPREKLIVFVDGCFWHGCRTCGHTPKTRTEFWTQKVVRNRHRDRLNTVALSREGFKVIRFWEHDLRRRLPACVETIRATLQG
jgi:DNA mismatch endonuclease Vsr